MDTTPAMSDIFVQCMPQHSSGPVVTVSAATVAAAAELAAKLGRLVDDKAGAAGFALANDKAL